MKRWIYIGILAGTIMCTMAQAQTLVYEKQKGKKVCTYNYEITPEAQGYAVQHTFVEKKKIVYTMSAVLDKDYNTRSWVYSYPKEKTSITAARKGDVVLLEGVFKGNKISKKFKLNRRPWKEFFPIDLFQFVVSTEKKIIFCCIGTSDMGAMEIGEISAKKDGVENIKINGQVVSATHLKVTFTDWKSMFWSGDFWCRETDGQYILYKGAEGPGGPKIVTSLVSEANLVQIAATAL